MVVPGEEAGAVAFRHALLQDVTYDSVPFARRRALHARVAEYLEATQAEPDHGLLVHHYRRAGDQENTRVHAVHASRSSVSVNANGEAVDYLQLALDTLHARTPRDACLRSRLEELMGESMATMAQHDEAVERFTRARRRWASPSVRRVCNDALGDVAPIDDPQGRDGLLCWRIALSTERGHSAYGRSLRWLAIGEASMPAQCKGTLAHILTSRGAILSRLGRLREAVDVGQRSVGLAREVGDDSLLADALNMLGNSLSTQGSLTEAIEHSTEALRLYEKIGDLSGQALSHAVLGADYTYSGDLSRSISHQETSLALHARLGNVNGVAFQHMNLGGALLQMGELDDAIEHLEEAIALATHPGVNPFGIGFSYLLLARAQVWSGRLEQAGQALGEGVRILEDIGAQSYLLDADIVACELCLARGDAEKAEEVCRSVIDRARAMSADISEGEALTMLGRVLLARDDPDPAIPALEASIVIAERGGSDYERARAIALLAEAERLCGVDEQSCTRKIDEAIHMFEQMDAGHDLAEAVGARQRVAAGVRVQPRVAGAEGEA